MKRRSSPSEVFLEKGVLKYAINLQENIRSVILKSYIGVGVLL